MSDDGREAPGYSLFFGSVAVGVFALMQNSLMAMPTIAFIVYGLFNVAQTGPGLVSGAGVLGVELAPTRIRSLVQGITGSASQATAITRTTAMIAPTRLPFISGAVRAGRHSKSPSGFSRLRRFGYFRANI